MSTAVGAVDDERVTLGVGVDLQFGLPLVQRWELHGPASLLVVQCHLGDVLPVFEQRKVVGVGCSNPTIFFKRNWPRSGHQIKNAGPRAGG